MHDQSDAQLLRAYAERGLEAAFAEIVARHTDLIYSAALRQVYSPDLARDVTQSVFTDLTRKARAVSLTLPPEGSLVGWLYRGTRYAARDLNRSETRRTQRERLAMEQLHPTPETPPHWEQLRPTLDEAMSELDETDRDAVLLRYFKNYDLRTVGTALGISDDAAQKRVSRAVERLRELFAKRGITVGTSGLAVIISTNAVQAAPLGLATAIFAATALTGTTLATAATVTATKAIAMTAIQKTIVAATIAVLAGAGIYEARRAAHLRDQLQTLQQQQLPQSEQIQQLRQERDETVKQLLALRQDNDRLSQNSSNLLRLRGEVARLRADKEQVEQAMAKLAAASQSLAGKDARKTEGLRLKQLLEQMPEQKIPELSLLTDSDYLNVAINFDLKTDESIKAAFSALRYRAENMFAIHLQYALQQRMQAGHQSAPANLLETLDYFDPPANASLLERYEVISTDTNVVAGWSSGWVVTQKSTVAPDQDHRWAISPVGFGPANLKWPEQKSVNMPQRILTNPNP